jgi:hypothetical protein
MAVTINASTSAGLVTSADTSGDLNIQSGGSTKIAVTSAGVAVTGTLSASGGISRASLPTGSVLQVVQGTYATVVTNSTGTYADSGLTASITPTSATSKILVCVTTNAQAQKVGTYAYGFLNLVRNSTQLLERLFGTYSTVGAEVSSIHNFSVSYLDSPATTSSTTYKMQLKNGGSGMITTTTYDGYLSTIVLMEIAA